MYGLDVVVANGGASLDRPGRVSAGPQALDGFAHLERWLLWVLWVVWVKSDELGVVKCRNLGVW